METETSESGEMAEERMEVEGPEEPEMESDPGGWDVSIAFPLAKGAASLTSLLGVIRTL